MFRNQASISDYYRALLNQVQDQILREKDETILHSNTDELVDYYFSSRWCPPGLNYGRSEMQDADAVYHDALQSVLKSSSGNWKRAEQLAARIRRGFEWKVLHKSRLQEHPSRP